MRKINWFIVTFLLVVVLSGCRSNKDKKTEPEFIDFQKPVSEYLGKDTMEVNALVDSFLVEMNAHRFENAVSMIYHIKSDSIESLSKEQSETQIKAFLATKGVRYEPMEIIFHEDMDNQAKFKVILFEKENDDPRPNEVSFALRPVRLNGKWFLTITNDMDKSVKKSVIKN